MVIFNKETKTYPYVFHANGNAKNQDENIWKVILKEFLASNIKEKDLDKSLTIVTLKGGRYAEVETVLEKTCKKYGVALKILKWPNINDFWEATKAKNYEMVKAIDRGEITTTYIMPLDCSDVILLKHPNDVLDDYLKIFPNKGSVWNGESNNWPRFDLPKYVHHPVLDDYLTRVSDRDVANSEKFNTRFAFLNSGAAIGRTDKLRTFYKTSLDLFAKVRTVDQAMARISQYILEEEHAIDIQCKIFQCLYGTNKSQFEIRDE